MEQICKNCNEIFTGSYCNTCGQAAKLKRIDKHYISHEVFHLFHFEKGFFYTAKEMLIRPGETAREFIGENRSRLMKPVAFLILTALIFTLTAYLTHADQFYNQQTKDFSKASKAYAQMLNWLIIHHNYGNLLSGFFTAISCALLYKKEKHNFYETLIMVCFVIGLNTLLLSVGNLLYGVIKELWMNTLITTATFIYTTWAISQFYYNKLKKVSGYLKAVFAYILGQSLMHICLLIIGITIDSVIKIWPH
ncbi:hypothetical protein A5893_10635 [Pedobacter psychrophilus]|uniref:DUF3667 domain-containing protein n=1 Tax=Pedobacter psychrophilus TaxID=1826909 RepID=A0A179DDS7_9SPHI|nr:DUF3667 domain-containing protein [Pedobacter psychrophilus]OAQ39118.1 hypothetical protein A5893_10635 [Pedobacter psychrophilus]